MTTKTDISSFCAAEEQAEKIIKDAEEKAKEIRRRTGERLADINKESEKALAVQAKDVQEAAEQDIRSVKQQYRQRSEAACKEITLKLEENGGKAVTRIINELTKYYD